MTSTFIHTQFITHKPSSKPSRCSEPNLHQAPTSSSLHPSCHLLFHHEDHLLLFHHSFMTILMTSSRRTQQKRLLFFLNIPHSLCHHNRRRHYNHPRRKSQGGAEMRIRPSFQPKGISTRQSWSSSVGSQTRNVLLSIRRLATHWRSTK